MTWIKSNTANFKSRLVGLWHVSQRITLLHLISLLPYYFIREIRILIESNHVIYRALRDRNQENNHIDKY